VITVAALAAQVTFGAPSSADATLDAHHAAAAEVAAADAALVAVGSPALLRPGRGGDPGTDCRPDRKRPRECRPAPSPDPAPQPDPDPTPDPDPDPIPDPTPDPAPLPTPSGAHFDILLSGDLGGRQTGFWEAPYYRSLPYTSMYDVGWIDGDRVGYSCAYMFLEADGAIVGRVTFTRPDEAGGYATVNDRFMVEGVRYYDGTLSSSGAAQLNDCPDPSQDYGPPDGPDQRPLIYYTMNGELLENRSYTNTTGEAIVEGDLIFRELERITSPFTDVGPLGINAHTVYHRVSVGAYVFTEGEWRLAIVIYYDSLSPSVPIAASVPAGASSAAATAATEGTTAAEAAPALDTRECRTGSTAAGAAASCRRGRSGR
jgi:hypothetical protein